MSKNNIMLLSFVLGYFGLFQISISSEMPEVINKQPAIEKELYASYFRNTTVKGNVFICKGPGSKRYHYKKYCRGLKSCSTKIYEVSLSKANELKRTLCGWED